MSWLCWLFHRWSKWSEPALAKEFEKLTEEIKQLTASKFNQAGEAGSVTKGYLAALEDLYTTCHLVKSNPEEATVRIIERVEELDRLKRKTNTQKDSENG